MGKHVAFYRCPSCGATKEIREPSCASVHPHCRQVFPTSVFCGWRGCSDRARREY